MLALMSIGVVQADEKAGQDYTLTAKEFLLGGAVSGSNTHTKNSAETQAAKAVASAEALKLLEILENPEKRQKAIDSLKNKGSSSCNAVNVAPNAQDWWASA